MARRLLLLATLATLAGLASATVWRPITSTWSLVGALAVTASVVVVRSRRPRSFGAATIVALAFVWGWLAAPTAPDHYPVDHLARRLGEGPDLLRLEGEVVGPVEVGRSGSARFVLEGIRLGPEREERTGRVRRDPSTVRRLLAPRPDDRVTILGRCRRLLDVPSNPGQPDPRVRRRATGVTHTVTARAANVRVTRRSLGIRARLAALRRRLAARLRRALPAEEAALAGALLLGRRGEVPTEIEDEFRASGTVHLLAVSGLHVGLIVAALHLLLRRMGVSERGTAIAVLVVAPLFAGLAGLRAPVVRAALFAGFWALARLVRRRAAALDLVAATAVLVLTVSPASALRTDFQLSFLAVTGLVLMTRPIRDTLFPDEVILARFAAVQRAGRLGRLRAAVRRALSSAVPMSLAAWLATAPLVAHRFGVLTPGALAGNLLLLPLLIGALFGAVVALVVGPGIVASGATLFIRALPAGASAVAAIPGLRTIESDRVELETTLVAYVVIGACVAALARTSGRRRLRPAILAVALLAPVVAFATTWPRRAPPRPRITILDVRQGCSVLVERPDGRAILYDAGSTSPDIGRRVIVPALRARRVRRLEALVLSHADADHVSAVATLLRKISVGRVLVPLALLADDAADPIVAAARDAGTPIVATEAGDELPGFGVFLHPPRDGPNRGRNDRSLVLRVELGGGVRALLTGDLEMEGVAVLLDAQPDLSAQFLLLPHHGGRNELLGRLIATVRPRSVAASASERFPREALAAGLDAWSTHASGALVIDAPNGRLRVRPHRRSSPVATRSDK